MWRTLRTQRLPAPAPLRYAGGMSTDLTATIQDARAALSKLVPLAVEPLAELAVGAERDNVRLAAAEAILDRSGLGRGATLDVTTNREQHEQATVEALALVERLAKNKGALPTHTPSLDALLVLEADEVELPVAGTYAGAIEAHAE